MEAKKLKVGFLIFFMLLAISLFSYKTLSSGNCPECQYESTDDAGGCFYDQDGTPCSQGECESGVCVPPETDPCENNQKDGDETDVDCGGTCNPCDNGKSCSANTDCASEVCSNGVCQDTCSNSQKDGSETDIDCGGNCEKCQDGKQCSSNTDCQGGYCQGNTCASSPSTCSNSQKDGSETDVDCGGSVCPTKCDNTKSCSIHTDCKSNYCDESIKKCADTPEGNCCSIFYIYIEGGQSKRGQECKSGPEVLDEAYCDSLAEGYGDNGGAGTFSENAYCTPSKQCSTNPDSNACSSVAECEQGEICCDGYCIIQDVCKPDECTGDEDCAKIYSGKPYCCGEAPNRQCSSESCGDEDNCNHDGECVSPETEASCPDDCGNGEEDVCGDGECTGAETEASCPNDCSSNNGDVCGDGACTGSETAASCYSDCGRCGDGVCTDPETSTDCPGDCKGRDDPLANKCIDGKCGANSHCDTTTGNCICNEAFSNCNGNGEDGCETDLKYQTCKDGDLSKCEAEKTFSEEYSIVMNGRCCDLPDQYRTQGDWFGATAEVPGGECCMFGEVTKSLESFPIYETMPVMCFNGQIHICNIDYKYSDGNGFDYSLGDFTYADVMLYAFGGIINKEGDLLSSEGEEGQKEAGFICTNVDDMPPELKGLGEWKEAQTSKDWNTEIGGYCSENKCYVSKEALEKDGIEGEEYCAETNEYAMDHLCSNGVWYTRTEMIAASLNAWASTNYDIEKIKGYTIYCNDYESALNYIDYETSTGDKARDFFGEWCENSVRCTNNVCALVYDDQTSKGKKDVVFATSLNQPISTEPYSFLAALEKQPNACDNTLIPLSTEFKYCGATDGNVYYSPTFNSIIYRVPGSDPMFSPLQSAIGILETFEKEGPIAVLKSEVAALPLKDEETGKPNKSKYNFTYKTHNLAQIYIYRQNQAEGTPLEITGIADSGYDGTAVTPYEMISYKGFSWPAGDNPICNDKHLNASCYSVPKNNHDFAYLVSLNPDIIGNFDALTAALRPKI